MKTEDAVEALHGRGWMGWVFEGDFVLLWTG